MTSRSCVATLSLFLVAVGLVGCPRPQGNPPVDAAPDIEPMLDVFDAAVEADAGLDAVETESSIDAALDVARMDAALDAADDAAGDATGDAADVPGREAGVLCTGDAGAGTRIRVAAANTTSGTQQSYEGPGIRIFQGLRPDIVMVQEFRYLAGSLRALVDLAFGAEFEFFVEEPAGTGIPNGIISRYPILASGEWDDARTPDRDFVWARIDIPGPTDLWAISVHLSRSSEGGRALEARDLLAQIAMTVPAGDYLVVGGDLNANTESEMVLSVFSETLTLGPPYPVDQLGNNRTSGNRSRPYDWVMARPNLAMLEAPLQVGEWCYEHGLVFDSRVFAPLSDVAPVLPDDSAAFNMQHMLVVRDYVLPTP